MGSDQRMVKPNNQESGNKEAKRKAGQKGFWMEAQLNETAGSSTSGFFALGTSQGAFKYREVQLLGRIKGAKVPKPNNKTYGNGKKAPNRARDSHCAPKNTVTQSNQFLSFPNQPPRRTQGFNGEASKNASF